MAEGIEPVQPPTPKEIAGLDANSGSIQNPSPRKPVWRWILLWSAVAVVLVIVGLGIAAQIALDRVEPILRARVVETLTNRFDSRVTLGEFHVSVFRGFEVEGAELRLYPRRFATNQPLIHIAKFSFRTSWISLFRSPMQVGRVSVEGMTIVIPPKEQRVAAAAGSAQPVGAGHPTSHAGTKIVVDEILIQNARLIIATSKPGKVPLDFEISRILLRSVGPGQPMTFEATLVNPKPVGNIQSTGYFGPFQQESPGDTPISGSYVFNHANLATFKGIAGILSSMGKYQGPLDRLVVDGQADVPDFRLNTGNHPMPLHTVFHAIVDGTSGDTYLQPVQAQLAHSHFTVTGSVVRVPPGAAGPRGHNINLNVVMNAARIEDFLKLAVHTEPPVMNGNLQMNARLSLPPGDVPITQKMRLKGVFDVSGASFSNEKIQQKINLLSRLGEGKPKDPDFHTTPPQPETNIPAEVRGDFDLADSQMDFQGLDFNVPGSQVSMNGIYTLDGSKFDFHGKAMLHAHPSQMTTGWKSLLLKLADPFFAKEGYGTVVPIQVSGTRSEPHFGLDFGYKPPVTKQTPPRR